MLIPLAAYLARRTRRKLWWAAAALLSLGAIATVSRTSVLMLIVVGLVFLWLRPVETKRLWPALLPLAIVVHLALPGTLGSLKGAFFPEGGLIAEQAGFAGYRGSGRVADLAPSLDQFASQPLLGLGFATRVVDEGLLENAAILDNQWLGLLLETGVVGVLGLLWLFSRAVRRFGAAAKEDQSDRGWLLAAVAASLTGYAVGMITFDAFSFIQVTFVMFVLLALGAVVSRLDREG
jgi:O-antigen ligase